MGGFPEAECTAKKFEVMKLVSKRKEYVKIRKKFKKIEMTVIMSLKILMYVSLFFTFFGLFSIDNWQILTVSRTMAITMSTFVVVGLAFISIYGGYNIGKRKSKPIIYSISLATVMTDIVTYVQLMIMNVNNANNSYFQFEFLEILVLVIFLQIIIIIAFTYGGNYIYFKINPPEKCIIVTSSQEGVDCIMKGIGKYRKQFKIKFVLDYADHMLMDKILRCDTVFIYDIPVEDRTKIVEFCYEYQKNVYFNPQIGDVVEINANHFIFDDVSLIGAEFKGMSIEKRIMKRIMDIVCSAIGLVLVSPLLLICAILIKCNDGGKVFFKQNRATKHGKVFSLYKFRTMKENVENYSSTEGDDRITKVGHVLRKYRIDELPQLWNVLKGDMSLVGPRPEMLENIFHYTEELPEFEYRLRVKAGLTGYAQIAGKYNTSPKDKLILDLMYIENYSLWLDIKLLFQTVIVFLKKDSTEGFKVVEQNDNLKYKNPRE